MPGPCPGAGVPYVSQCTGKTDMRKIHQSGVFDCGDGRHQVVTLTASGEDRLAHRAKPCEQCPWRADLPTGVFPASAFRHSAASAYDMARNTFACHMSGKEKTATCAGFLLRGADHNLSIRLAIVAGRYRGPRAVSDGGFPLYQDYRAMAEANGVDPDDDALLLCRGGDEERFWRKKERRRKGL